MQWLTLPLAPGLPVPPVIVDSESPSSMNGPSTVIWPLPFNIMVQLHSQLLPTVMRTQ